MEMESYETDGSLSKDALQNQYWDMAFMGISAVDLAHGITSINRQISDLENLMMTHSRKVIALCDSSKFNRYAYARAGSIDMLDVLVTDSGISDQFRSEINDLDVEVVVADMAIELS